MQVVWEPIGVNPAEVPLPLRRLSVRVFKALADATGGRVLDIPLAMQLFCFSEVLDARAEAVATVKLLYGWAGKGAVGPDVVEVPVAWATCNICEVCGG